MLMDPYSLLDKLDNLHGGLAELESSFGLATRKRFRNTYYLVDNFNLDVGGDVAQNTTKMAHSVVSVVNSLIGEDANWNIKVGKMVLRSRDKIDMPMLRRYIEISSRFPTAVKLQIIRIFTNIERGDTAAYT